MPYFNPDSLEPYAPLWHWGADGYRSYLHLAGVRNVLLDTFHTREGNTTATMQISRCSSPAPLAVLEDEEAIVARLRPWRGPLLTGIRPWGAADIVVWVHRQKQAMRYQGTLLLNTHTGEAVAELPYLTEAPEIRKLLLSSLRDGLLELLPGAQRVGVSTTTPQHRTSHSILTHLPGVAFEGGFVTAEQTTVGRIRVNSSMGDRQVLSPVSLSEEVPSKQLTALAETLVLEPTVPGLVRMITVPPKGIYALTAFNKRIAPAAHRLFSWELLRVLQALRTMYQWYTRWPELSQMSHSEKEANLVKDKKLGVFYVCLDEFSRCFYPIPHIWRHHVDTTWHGLPAPEDLDRGVLGRL